MAMASIREQENVMPSSFRQNLRKTYVPKH